LRAGEKAATMVDRSGKMKCARRISSACSWGFSRAEPSAALKAEPSAALKAAKWAGSRAVY
jgi:hypothetical protein